MHGCYVCVCACPCVGVSVCACVSVYTERLCGVRLHVRTREYVRLGEFDVMFNFRKQIFYFIFLFSFRISSVHREEICGEFTVPHQLYCLYHVCIA